MRSKHILSRLSMLLLAALSTSLLNAQSTNVLTSRNNNRRDGQNPTETSLTQKSVSRNKFGKICSTAPGSIDGQVYAQPLVVTGGIPGYNHVAYVETENDTLYALDGDSTNCAVISHTSLLQSQEEAVQCTDVGGKHCSAFDPIIGIVGTPVIDPDTNTMYLVTWTESTAGSCATNKAPACFVHRLHALNIQNGAEKYNGPVTIPAVTIGNITFTSFNHIQRPGLLLLPKIEQNGHSAIYAAFSEMDGGGVVGQSIPNGWIFSFDAQDLSVPPTAWTNTPKGEGGGVWMSGAGLAAGVDKPKGDMYIYFSTGDGTFDVENGGADYGDSFVKLTPTLTVSASFTPYNQYCDDINDGDLGSGGIMLVPNGIGSSTVDFALTNGKDGNIYVLDRSNPGGYNGPTTNTCPTSGSNLNYETVATGKKPFYSTATFWNSNLYAVANSSPLRKYKISATGCNPGPVCTTPLASSSSSFGFAPQPVISSNNDKTGTAVVWAMKGNGWPHENKQLGPAAAILYAFDAEHVQHGSELPELWNSQECPTRDGAGYATKMTEPTVANGRVFIGTMDPTDQTNTRGEVDVYGATKSACK